MLPDPVPAAPDTIVTQAALGLAAHVHEAADAVTVTVASPPTPGSSWLAGAIVNVQTGDGSVPLSLSQAASPRRSARPSAWSTARATVPGSRVLLRMCHPHV